MSDCQYDVVVIGAGIVGSCTAHYLAKNGSKVLMLEQFPLPHTRGSSHGQSRLIRTAYKQPFFTKMMLDAFPLWRQLEKETGKELIWNTGVVLFASLPNDGLAATENNMTTYCPEHYSSFSLDEAKLRYPMFNFTENKNFIVDKSGGVIKAGIALQTVQNLFLASGGEIVDGCPVTGIHCSPDRVELTTPVRTITAKSVVICCGPWTNKILKLTNLELPLQPQRVETHYFRDKSGGQYTRAGGFVPFLNMDRTTRMSGMPSLEYPGMAKIFVHYGVDCDPDNRDKCEANPVRDMLKDFIRRHLLNLDPEASIVEACMYTVTPDESFILDYHPKHKNIVIGAGFSGTGFKLSPLVGQILGELVTGQKPCHDLKPFAINRFN